MTQTQPNDVLEAKKRQARRLILWIAIFALVALIGLSIAGSFLGAERAKKLFNSPPLVICWFALVGLFLAGFVYFKRLLRSPVALATHLACLLVLGGAMYSSERGHLVAQSALGIHKIPSGMMQIYEGQTESNVFDKDTGEPIGQLPFAIQLNKFWLEYYPVKRTTWHLVVGLPHLDETGKGLHWEDEDLDWAVGRETKSKSIDATVKVLQYIPHARPVYPQGAVGAIEVTPDGGETIRVPAEVGKEVEIDKPKATLRIVQVFQSARVMGFQSGGLTEDPEGKGPPALGIEVEQPDKEKKTIYAFSPEFTMHQKIEGLNVFYVSPRLVGAESDPDSTVPAMEVVIEKGDKGMNAWLLPREGQTVVSMPLEVIAGQACSPEEHARTKGACCESGQHMTPSILLAQPIPDIRDYKSDLSVLVNGNEVARKTIEVNDPLHFEGYHFYQSSYDKEASQYTVLDAVSDSGLLAVYAGFALLTLGVFWGLWLRPAWALLTKRKE